MAILFVREGCTFCQDLPTVPGLTTFKVVDVDGRPHTVVGDDRIPLPQEVRGLPALLIGHELFIGKEPIRKKLEELAHAPA